MPPSSFEESLHVRAPGAGRAGRALGFRVSGLGQGLEVWGAGFRVSGVGVRGQGSGFRCRV